MENSEGSKNNKLHIVRDIIVILAVVALVGGACYFLYGKLSGKNDPVYKRLVELADAENKNSSVMIDSVQRFDSAAASRRKITYTYTLVDVSADEFDVEYFTREIRSGLIDILKTDTDEDTVFFRENKITVVFLYNDKNGKEIVKIEITPNDLK